MAPARNVPLPPGLSAIAAGRDNILTAELAHVTGHAPQTIRKNFCLTGECFGLVPVKVGNRLLWNVRKIASLLSEG